MALRGHQTNSTMTKYSAPSKNGASLALIKIPDFQRGSWETLHVKGSIGGGGGAFCGAIAA